jgi:hypothetical protein
MSKTKIKLTRNDFCSCELGKKHHIQDVYCNACGKFWIENKELLRMIRKNNEIRLIEREIQKKKRKPRAKRVDLDQI